MIDVVDGYYSSERMGAAICFGLSLVAVGSGAYLARTSVGMLYGMGWSLLIAGGLVLLASGAYFAGLGSNHARFSALLGTDPSQFLVQESAHLTGAIESLRRVIYGEMLIALTGIILALAGHIRETPILTGVGLGMALVLVLLTGYDSLNRSRASGYHQEIQAVSR
ncbi:MULTISPECIES: hypothetical protein [Cupriavidus]